jgi:hypothetical protein
MKSTLLLVSVITSLAAVLLLLPVYGMLFLAQQLSYTRDKKGNKPTLVSL